MYKEINEEASNYHILHYSQDAAYQALDRVLGKCDCKTLNAWADKLKSSQKVPMFDHYYGTWGGERAFFALVEAGKCQESDAYIYTTLPIFNTPAQKEYFLRACEYLNKHERR